MDENGFVELKRRACARRNAIASHDSPLRSSANLLRAMPDIMHTTTQELNENKRSFDRSFINLGTPDKKGKRSVREARKRIP